jgi:hypothetical protein
MIVDTPSKYKSCDQAPVAKTPSSARVIRQDKTASGSTTPVTITNTSAKSSLKRTQARTEDAPQSNRKRLRTFVTTPAQSTASVVLSWLDKFVTDGGASNDLLNALPEMNQHMESLGAAGRFRELGLERLEPLASKAASWLEGFGQSSLSTSMERYAVAANEEGTAEAISYDMDACQRVLQLCRLCFTLHVAQLQLPPKDGTAPRQLISEQVMLRALEILRQQLDATILFGLDLGANQKSLKSHSHLFNGDPEKAESQQDLRSALLSLFQNDQIRRLFMDILVSFTHALAGLLALMKFQPEAVADDVAIPTTYMCLSALLLESSTAIEDAKIDPKISHCVPSVFAASLFTSVQHAAMRALTWIFRNCRHQRGFLLEEILSNLTRLPSIQLALGKKVTASSACDEDGLPLQYGSAWGGSLDGKATKTSIRPVFRLPDGKFVHSCSLLLFNLIQSCCDDWWKTDSTLRLGAEIDPEERMKLVKAAKDALEQAMAASAHVFRFLIKRCEQKAAPVGSTRSRKRPKKTMAEEDATSALDQSPTNYDEYRMIFDGLVSDLLSLLNNPEWPVAPLMLGVLAQLLIDTFDSLAPTYDGSTTPSHSKANIQHKKLLAAELLSWIFAKVRKQRGLCKNVDAGIEDGQGE